MKTVKEFPFLHAFLAASARGLGTDQERLAGTANLIVPDNLILLAEYQEEELSNRFTLEVVIQMGHAAAETDVTLGDQWIPSGALFLLDTLAGEP